jgi:hypothetical protein
LPSRVRRVRTAGIGRGRHCDAGRRECLRAIEPGTGRTLRFPPVHVTAPVHEGGIGDHHETERRDARHERRRTLADMLEAVAASHAIADGQRRECVQDRDQRRRTYAVHGHLIATARGDPDTAHES